jgi:L-ascorbate metabolism protein UlaG (beta-lactamase superfamily)
MLVFWLVVLIAGGYVMAQTALEFKTASGPLRVTPLGHASLLIEYDGMTIHVDPWSNVADYSTLPPADWVWITHDHPDHYDEAALSAITTGATRFIMNPSSAERYAGSEEVTILENGDSLETDGFTLEAVPAYNLVRERAGGQKYHPKGLYNGYVATFGEFRIYIAGDTECIPEMKAVQDIDLMFVPINLPYTMPPEEAVGCIKVVSPQVVVPYHQGDSDPQVVADLLRNSGIEVRVLDL